MKTNMLKETCTVLIIQDDVIQSPWAKFHNVIAEVVHEDGKIATYQREFLDRGNAIAVLAVCYKKGTVLLVRQFRLPVYYNAPEDAWLLEACGGMLQGKSIEQTVEEETVEELGIKLHSFRKVFSAYSSPGSITEKIDYFIAQYDSDAVIPQSAGNSLEDEETIVEEITFAAAARGIQHGDICDLRTIALFNFLMSEIPHPI